MPTTRKTKAELLDEISALMKELELTSRIDKYTEAANEVKAMYDALLEAGFNENMAEKILQLFLYQSITDKPLTYKKY